MKIEKSFPNYWRKSVWWICSLFNKTLIMTSLVNYYYSLQSKDKSKLDWSLSQINFEISSSLINHFAILNEEKIEITLSH